MRLEIIFTNPLHHVENTMRAVIQRVSRGCVEVDGITTGSIGQGLLVLLGVHTDDTESDVRKLADKIVNLRIFDDTQGIMNRSLLDISGELLVVSQFTLYGDCRKGRRPSWSSAAPPEQAEKIYQLFLGECVRLGVPPQTGRFQADMKVTLTNDGPVTLLIDTLNNF